MCRAYRLLTPCVVYCVQSKKTKKCHIHLVGATIGNEADHVQSKMLRAPKRYQDCVTWLGEDLKKTWRKKIEDDKRRSRAKSKVNRKRKHRDSQSKSRSKLKIMEKEARSQTQTLTPVLMYSNPINKSPHPTPPQYPIP